MSDAKELAAALSNPKILNNLRDGIPYPYTEGDAASYISAMQKADPNTTFAYAITLEDRAIGSIGVFRQGNIHARTAELGYYLAEEYWGKDLMTEAVRRICKRVLRKRISYASMPSLFLIMPAHGGCWKRRAFAMKGCCAVTPSSTAG